eukprot:2003293-Prymnesium_polylepis.1
MVRGTVQRGVAEEEELHLRGDSLQRELAVAEEELHLHGDSLQQGLAVAEEEELHLAQDVSQGEPAAAAEPRRSHARARRRAYTCWVLVCMISSLLVPFAAAPTTTAAR